MKHVLFIEAGFGADQHGQNATKAAVRACRNAIEFNSIPSIAALIPGGYDRMALRVTLALPPGYAASVDTAQVKKVFPYGVCDLQVVEGGGLFSSGIALPAMDDRNDDMIVAIAHVAVGELTDTAKDPSKPASLSHNAATPRKPLHIEPDVETLVDSLIHQYRNLALDNAGPRERALAQLWVGVAGAPGSGKSTLSQQVARRLQERGHAAAVLPMDGFHYSKAELDAFEDPEQAHLRRGAPFTFDAPGLVSKLKALKHAGRGRMPSFDHAVGDPVADAIELAQGTKIVLVEGNYLLLWDREPWSDLSHFFDTTWFVECLVRGCCMHLSLRRLNNSRNGFNQVLGMPGGCPAREGHCPEFQGVGVGSRADLSQGGGQRSPERSPRRTDSNIRR
jgi:uncharacterized protein (TIGR02058 family)